MSVLKKLAGETAMYGVSSILGRLLNYALVPLHTAVFVRPAEMSIIVELYAYVAFFNVLYTYGMETAFFRFASKTTDRKYYNIALSSILLSSILLSGSFIVFSSDIAVALGYPQQGYIISWLAIILAIDAIVAIPFAQLRLEKKAATFVKARMINIGINVALNFFFLWFCRSISEGKWLAPLKPFIATIYNPDLGVGYIVLANLIANAAFFLLLYPSFARFRFTLGKEDVKSMLIYGYPILIMGLAGITNQMFDRAMLEKLLPTGFYENLTSKDALGIYGNCYKLSIFMSLAIQAFRYAAEPFFFSQADDKNSPHLFADVMKWFVIVCAIIWLGVSVNLDILGQLFLRSPLYRTGLAVVPVLLLANLFLGVYYNLSIWFKLTDRTYYGTWITMTGAAISIVGNILLIPVLGYMGCAYTFLLSCLVMTVICYILGNKYYPVPYDLKSAAIYILSAGALIYLANYVSISNQFLATGFHLLLCLLFAALVFAVEKPQLTKTANPAK
jgi:O-antigen/teichoic acid export membrane protein